MKKTHWKSAYKSVHLNSSDLDGKEIVLTIVSVKREEHRKELCNIAYFKEKGYKPMRLNVGNAKIVKEFCGGHSHIEDWELPILVTIYVDPRVNWGRDTVEGLRIRATQPKSQSQLPKIEYKNFASAVEYLKGGKTIEDLRRIRSFDKDMEKKLIFESTKR